MFSLDRLRTFGIFARHLSFTRAAQAAGLSQPALHTQVRLLQEEIGVALYVRHGRGLSLTDAGHRLAALAADIESRSRDLVARVRGTDDDGVTFAAGEGTLLYLLAPALRGWTGAADPITASTGSTRLRLRVLDGPAVAHAVRTGEARLGVAPLDVGLDGLVVHPRWTVSHVVLVPLNDLLATRSELHPCDLADRALVVPPPGRPLREALRACLEVAGTPWTVGMEASGWELLRQGVALGFGLAVVNDCCPAPAGAVAVPFVGLPARTYAVIERGDAWPSPGALRLRAALLAR